MTTIEQAQKLSKTLRTPPTVGLETEAADTIDALIAELASIKTGQEPAEIEWPEYHHEGMGCGLEDRNITDRYEAMQYGWDQAIERIAELIPENLYLAAGAQALYYGHDAKHWHTLAVQRFQEAQAIEQQEPVARVTRHMPILCEEIMLYSDKNLRVGTPLFLAAGAHPYSGSSTAQVDPFVQAQERKPFDQDWIEERAHRRCRRYIMIDTEAPYQFNGHTLMDLARDIEAKIKGQP